MIQEDSRVHGCDHIFSYHSCVNRNVKCLCMGHGFLYSTSYYFVVAEAEELVDKLYALMNPYDILTNIMQGCGSDRDIKR